MTRTVRLLMLEDSPSDGELLEAELQSLEERFEVRRVDNERDYVNALREFRPDVILADNALPGFTGWDAVEHAKDRCPQVPFIVVSGTIAEDEAVEFLKKGATDYVLKDRRARLGSAVSRALREVEERKERRLLTEQLRQVQKFEALGRLAGGVAHDFNNLITIILGYSDRAMDELGKEHPLYEELDEIRKAGHRARGLTSQLLAFSRKQTLRPTVINLNKLLNESRKMIGRLVGDRIGLSLALDEETWRIKVDRTGVEQVLLNLAANARDAMAAGGELTFGTANLKLDEPLVTEHSVVPPGEFVVLAVRDTGEGMDEKVRSRLFEPFFTTKAEGSGSGLGLSTVLGIVEQSGGVIAVESELGRGTTFRIYFPRIVEEAGAEPENAPGTAGPGSERILLVEDDRTVRMIAAHVLRGNGYTVMEAADGRQALKRASECAKDPIDLLLCDVSLPGIGGIEVAERLKGSRSGLKVLFTSGYTDGDVVPESIRDAKHRFLPKPFIPRELLWHVRKALDDPSESGSKLTESGPGHERP